MKYGLLAWRVEPSFWIIILSFLWVVVSVCALVVAGQAVGLLAATSPFLLYLLLKKSWVRVAVVVIGGMLVLGSSSEVGPLKVVYAGAFMLCALVASIRLATKPPTWIGIFRPVFIWGIVLLLCLFLAIAANPNQDITSVIRLAIFYVMIPFAPVIGIDAGRDAQSRVVMRWIGVIGCVAAVGFAADWLNRRGVSNLSFGRFVASSLVLPALAFALALVRAAYARGWALALWLVPIVVIPAAMLVTGTRTNLIVFLAVIGVVGAHAKYRVTFGRTIGLLAVGAALLVTVFPLVADAVIAQPGFIEARIRALQTVVTGSAGADLSFAARNEQYYYASQWIEESPWFGKGPGFSPPTSLDTPLAIVVRIGVVGTVALVFFLAAFLYATRTSARRHGFTYMHTATTGLAIVVAAYFPFGPVVEDKGFAFMLVLLSTGLAAYIQERVEDKPDLSERLPLTKPKTLDPSERHKHLAAKT